MGLSLRDAVPNETTVMRFRQRLREHGLQKILLRLVNRLLTQRGLILKTCALAAATLLQGTRRAPAEETIADDDHDADYTGRHGQTHYVYGACSGE